MDRQAVAGLIVLGVCSPIYAEGLYGILSRNLYGNVEFGYIKDTNVNRSYSLDQTTYTQKYSLGTRGSIYSPNFVSYVLQGAFLVQNIEGTASGEPSSSSRQTQNYRASADFLRITKFPFSVYAEKDSNPYSSLQAGMPLSYDEVNNRVGVAGSVSLPYFDLQYTADKTDLQRNETYANETRQGSSYAFSLSKAYEQLKFSASYMDRLQDYSRVDKNATVLQNWSDHARLLRANAVWSPDKTLSVNSNVTYNESSYVDLKSMIGNVNTSWSPSERFRLGGDASASTMQSSGVRSDTVMLSQNASYRMTPDVTAMQTASLYRITGDNTNTTVAFATAGSRYATKLDNNVSVNAGIDVGVRNERYNEGNDANATMPDKSVYNYTLSAGATKRIEALRANASASAAYYGSVSTADETSGRLSLNANYMMQVGDNTHFSMAGYYLRDENSYYSVGEGLRTMQTDQMTINSTLRYSNQLGYNGSYSLGAGVIYSSTQLDANPRFNRVLPMVDGSLSYRFFDALHMNSSLSASQDTVSDLTNYSAYFGLNYRLRKLTMSLGARHFRQNGGTDGMWNTTRNSYFFKVSRPF